MIGFYASGRRHGHAVRCLAMARHVPDSIVFSDMEWEDPWRTEGVAHAPLEAVWTMPLSCLVVDVFPLGRGGELAELVRWHPIPLVFIYRHVQPGSVDLGPVADYDRVLIAEPGPVEGDDCWPILIRDRDELMFGERRGHLTVTGPYRDWPLVEHMPLYESMTGGAGYNLFWESKLAGTPTLWRYRRTVYDDQPWRVQTFGTVDTVTNRARYAAFRVGEVAAVSSQTLEQFRLDADGVTWPA